MATVKILKTLSEKKVNVCVVFAKLNNKWLLCKHKNRETYEVPGGHVEQDEMLEQTATRELYEETGAIPNKLNIVCYFSESINAKDNFGAVYYADINKLEKLPNNEMREIQLFDDFPQNVTYKETYKILLPIVEEYLIQKIR